MNNKKYIIVAEDDEVYSDIYKRKLTSEGFEVLQITDGEKVLPAIRNHMPDLLILDLLIPGMSGFDILKNIRSDKLLADLKVIVGTNLSTDIEVSKIIKLGVKDYFIKSDTSISEMVSNVKKVLE